MYDFRHHIFYVFLLLHTACIAEFSLPSAMQELRDYELHQMESCLQKGPSCCWYASLNAYAIQELSKQKLPLTDENIQTHVQYVGLPFIQAHEKEIVQEFGMPLFEGISTEQQDYLVRLLGLTDYYHVTFYYKAFNEGQWLLFNKEEQWRSYVSLEELLKEIKFNHSPVIHILLSVPSRSLGLFYDQSDYHAVLISRIKRRAPKPFLLYMDSNNISLNPWIHETIQKPYFAGLLTVPFEKSWYVRPKNYQVIDHVCHFIKTIDML